MEIVQQHVPFLALLTPVPHNHAAAVDNFSGVAFPVKYAQPSPFAELLSVRHFDKRNLVFGAEGDDEFLVGFFFTAFIEDAHVCLAAIECFAGFAETTGETVVDEGKLEYTCTISANQLTVDFRRRKDWPGEQ